jgi:hypothetical protein
LRPIWRTKAKSLPNNMTHFLEIMTVLFYKLG